MKLFMMKRIQSLCSTALITFIVIFIINLQETVYRVVIRLISLPFLQIFYYC